ncbi:hypothetical protein GJ496_007269 [Pomphorhynchus laevis]|nr:hypothetical protein GJ496_007269 [Pomphorhynchus laevis]
MVPLGPTNSVAVLQLVMTEIINQNKLENTFVYIDVVVVAGTTLDEHDRNLRLFQLLPGYLTFLWHLIAGDMIRSDPERLAPLHNMPKPKD